MGERPIFYAVTHDILGDLSREDPLERQLAHFCEVIRGECDPIVTAQDALQNLRVTNAISESARSGRIVPTFEGSSP